MNWQSPTAASEMSNCHRKDNRKCFLSGLLIRQSTAKGVATKQTASLTQIQQPQILFRVYRCNSVLAVQFSGAISPMTSCSQFSKLQMARGLPRAAHPVQKPGTHCSTSKSTEQWCVGTKPTLSTPNYNVTPFHAHIWILWARCVSKTLNLFITQMYTLPVPKSEQLCSDINQKLLTIQQDTEANLGHLTTE